jgi:hypothetical protein
MKNKLILFFGLALLVMSLALGLVNIYSGISLIIGGRFVLIGFLFTICQLAIFYFLFFKPVIDTYKKYKKSKKVGI